LISIGGQASVGFTKVSKKGLKKRGNRQKSPGFLGIGGKGHQTTEDTENTEKGKGFVFSTFPQNSL
jgi:hypothetical protein